MSKPPPMGKPVDTTLDVRWQGFAKRDWTALEFAPEVVKSDRAVISQAIREQSGLALQHATEELRGEQELVLEAVKHSQGMAARFATAELLADQEFMLDAVEEQWEAGRFVGPEIRGDPDVWKEFITECVARNWKCLDFLGVDDPLRGDEMLIDEAIRYSGLALKYASEEVRQSKDRVLLAVRDNWRALDYAADELREDEPAWRDLVLEATKQNWHVFVGAEPDDLRGDREIVREAVRQNGVALGYCATPLQNDRELVMAAVRQTWRALEFASEELQADREIVALAVAGSWEALRYGSEALRNDRDLVLGAVRQSWKALLHASAELRGDRELVLEALRQDGLALQYASDELRADREVVQQAMRDTWLATEFGWGALCLVDHDWRVLKTADTYYKDILDQFPDLPQQQIRSPKQADSPKGRSTIRKSMAATSPNRKSMAATSPKDPASGKRRGKAR